MRLNIILIFLLCVVQACKQRTVDYYTSQFEEDDPNFKQLRGVLCVYLDSVISKDEMKKIAVKISDDYPSKKETPSLFYKVRNSQFKGYWGYSEFINDNQLAIRIEYKDDILQIE